MNDLVPSPSPLASPPPDPRTALSQLASRAILNWRSTLSGLLTISCCWAGAYLAESPDHKHLAVMTFVTTAKGVVAFLERD